LSHQAVAKIVWYDGNITDNHSHYHC